MPAQNLTSYSEDPEMEPEIQDHEDNELQTSPQNDASPPEEITLRRSARVSKQPAWLQDYISRPTVNIAAVTDHYVAPEFTCLLAAIAKTPDPLKFSDAVIHPHWQAAMNEELNALEENDTWDIVPLPANKTTI
ncbi:hypothetical protein AgCh_024933 [Apium graveolens]